MLGTQASSSKNRCQKFHKHMQMLQKEKEHVCPQHNNKFYVQWVFAPHKTQDLG